MSYVDGRLPFGDTQISSSLVFEEFVPPSAWTEDATCHYLLVDLPGFKRQELKLQIDNQTHILVSGERQVKENKYKRFEQKFELPKNADIDKISGKLDGEILYISVPKKAEQEHEEIKHGSSHSAKMDSFDPIPKPTPEPTKVSDVDQNDKDEGNNNGLERKKHRTDSNEDWVHEADLFMRLAIEQLKKHKGIVVTAVLAFSLGVLVTQKFQSNQH